MPDADLLSTLFDELIRAETEVWTDVDVAMTEGCGVPLARYEPMTVIDTVPDCRVSDVADALVITRGGASKLVDRLRADGWCTRTPHPTDGRSGFLALTPRGHQVLTEARATFRRAVAARLGDRLDEHDATRLVTLLRELRRPRPTN